MLGGGIPNTETKDSCVWLPKITDKYLNKRDTYIVQTRHKKEQKRNKKKFTIRHNLTAFIQLPYLIYTLPREDVDLS